MSETPRTDAAIFTTGEYPGEDVVNHTVARQLERDLAAAQARAEKADRLAEDERNWAFKRDADYAAAQDRVDDLTRKLAEAETRLLFLQRLADKCGTVTVHGLDGADGLAAYQLESLYRGLLYPSLAEAIDAAIAKEPK